MGLAEDRMRAAELSGGTSTSVIKDRILESLKAEGARGTLADFGAGKAELLMRIHAQGGYEALAGFDLFPRSAELPESIAWHQGDLNSPPEGGRQFDTVICSETIEHLENPRQTFRSLFQITRPGGLLILTMPNQESIRSYLSLVLRGHFAQFLALDYPAHITHLLRLDLVRLCSETGFEPPRFAYTNRGCVPKCGGLTWQGISFGILRGRLFSDNLMMVTRRAEALKGSA
jgi:2-polyprenyl-3-methyl-5-hydroxy-6-metoxy-1,4-benzoquinol methylase